MFPATHEGGLGKGHRVSCGCGQSVFIGATVSAPRGLPDDAVVKRLHARGWRVSKGGRDVKCSGCLTRKPKRMVETTAGPSCIIEGCDAVLAIPVDGKGWKVEGGMVNIPPSVVKQHAKAKGWSEVERGELACPIHAQGFAGGKVVLGYLASGKAPPAWLKSVQRQGQTFDEVMAAAEAHAAVCYGDRWPSMKATAEQMGVDLLAERAAIAELTTAAPAASPEGDTHMTTTPTRDQKRVILDFLGAHYDGDGWAKEWSDAKAATHLNLPRAWVTELRVEFFGDADVNEAQRAADKARQQALHQLQKDMKAAQAKMDTALSALGDAERMFAGLATRITALEKGN